MFLLLSRNVPKRVAMATRKGGEGGRNGKNGKHKILYRQWGRQRGKGVIE